MKVAVAGTGPVAQYMIEEFKSHGHNVIILSRSQKSEQRQTDYSVASLIDVLHDCDALVSTVADYQNPPAATQVHLNMIEACKQSLRCKTFVPSEWTSNVEEYPEQPMFFAEHNKILHTALKQETSIRWTIVSNSWFADYVVPQTQRLLRDVGPIWPMDHANKIFTIYGQGSQLGSFVSIRDIAKAVAILLDSKEPWEQYTYLSGDQLSWNELFTIIRQRDSQWTSQTKTLADSVRHISDNLSQESALVGYFEILSYSGALILPAEKIQRQRSKYFPNLHFRSVNEILAAAAERPDEIV